MDLLNSASHAEATGIALYCVIGCWPYRYHRLGERPSSRTAKTSIFGVDIVHPRRRRCSSLGMGPHLRAKITMEIASRREALRQERRRHRTGRRIRE